MRDYKLYLKDILTAIESIERFAAGMNADAIRDAIRDVRAERAWQPKNQGRP